MNKYEYPKVVVSTDILNDPGKGMGKEWIITNGLGGYASSTVIGCNTRRYHGLLAASRPQDEERMVLLSKVDEVIRLGHKFYPLSTNMYNENHIHPKGYQHLRKFQQSPFPRFVYTVGAVTVVKEIFMPRHSNTTVVRYEVFSDGANRFSFYLQPFLACRGFHQLQYENRQFSTASEYVDGALIMHPYESMPVIKIKAGGMRFDMLKSWYKNFQYPMEQERGLDYLEDLLCPGHFYINDVTELKIDFMVTCEEQFPEDVDREKEKCMEHIGNLIDVAGGDQSDPDEVLLINAADMHVIRQNLSDGNNRSTIIAGYHWFGDWGRDTFISLPGLTLATGRLKEAGDILEDFAGRCHHGLIPNRFGDLGQKPIYNTVDASLWFINGVSGYFRAGGDRKLLEGRLYGVCRDILDSYEKGTLFGIKMDEDGLLKGGEPGVQLTWMDARVDDWVVTPRHGKPVEINALWYNALRIMEEFACLFGDKKAETYWRNLGEKVRVSFNEKFWNEREGYLYDVLTEEGPDGKMRPNQIFAVSLPFAALDEDKWKTVVNKVYSHLFTPFGLRSLSSEDPGYKGIYRGNIRERDGAYHMGTAWGFLMGPFIEAFIKANRDTKDCLRKAEIIFNQWMVNLLSGGLSTLSEIFDGDEPFVSRGCISQAWTVGEALRIKKLLKSLKQVF